MTQKTNKPAKTNKAVSRSKKKANPQDFINKQATIIANQDKIIENQDIMLELKTSNFEIQAKIIANQSQIIEYLQTIIATLEKSKTVFLTKTKAKKGDVEFFEDENKRKYQRILNRDIFPLEIYKNNSKFIQKVNGMDIRYHTNGAIGFMVVNKTKVIQSNIWKLDLAIQIAKKAKT
jgi:hypothetical protein